MSFARTNYHVTPLSEDVPVLATEVPTETTKCSPPATANEYRCFIQIVKRAMIGIKISTEFYECSFESFQGTFPDRYDLVL